MTYTPPISTRLDAPPVPAFVFNSFDLIGIEDKLPGHSQHCGSSKKMSILPYYASDKATLTTLTALSMLETLKSVAHVVPRGVLREYLLYTLGQNLNVYRNRTHRNRLFPGNVKE